MRTTKSGTVRRQEIRHFLQSRRAAITPESVGLPSGSRRRTPGLRREEVASLAGVGVAWYTWLEQGREIRVSANVLERIAHALRLTPSDTEYLYSLPGIPRVESERGRVENVEKHVQDAIDSFQSGPAIFFNSRWDVLAYNRLADLIFEFDNYRGPFARNHIWRLFMDPQRRGKYLDWEALAEIGVRLLRSTYGKMPDDAYLSSMVRALCEGSADFKRLWEAQVTATPVEALRIGVKLPRFGDVYFTSVRFRSVSSPQVLALLIPADAKSASAMRKLSEGRPTRKKSPK